MFEWNLTTFLLSIINFLVLAGLLYKFLNKPLAAVLAQRRKKLQDVRDEAAASLEEARKTQSEYEAKLSGVDREQQKILSQARSHAEESSQRLLSEAHKRAEAEAAQAQRDLARQRQEALQTLENDIISLSIDLSRRTLRELTDEDLEESLFQKLHQALAAINPEDKDRIARRSREGTAAITVTTAADLDSASSDRIRQLLQETLGAPCTCHFKADAEALAGVRIEFETLAIDATLSGVLADFRRHYEAVASPPQDQVGPDQPAKEEPS